MKETDLQEVLNVAVSQVTSVNRPYIVISTSNHQFIMDITIYLESLQEGFW